MVVLFIIHIVLFFFPDRFILSSIVCTDDKTNSDNGDFSDKETTTVNVARMSKDVATSFLKYPPDC